MARLLVVDDDKNLQVLYKEEFEEEGYEVDVAGSGSEALEIVKKNKPDLVVLDISMPGMDGIEVLSKVLAQDKTISIILNTAYGTYKDNFMTWSADAYVVKSGDLTELKSKVREILDKKLKG